MEEKKRNRSPYRPRAKAMPDGRKRRGGHGKRDAIAMARRLVSQQRALELRIQGLTERLIAETLVKEGYAPHLTGAAVHQMLMEALDQITVPEAEKLKKLELQRLDGIINGHYANACNGDVGATHAVLACIDRRNRLLGIGQETKITNQQLGADGKPVDPIRPVINLTIAQVAPPLTNGKAASPVIEHKPVDQSGD